MYPRVDRYKHFQFVCIKMCVGYIGRHKSGRDGARFGPLKGRGGWDRGRPQSARNRCFSGSEPMMRMRIGILVFWKRSRSR